MCGIAGIVGASRLGADAEALIGRMIRSLRHRGPDDEGSWIDLVAGVALGHRRLAILDLSPQGHQPMKSARGRFVIAFNGEIYNFAALRVQLEADNAAPAWRGRSDTEILLAGVEAWGLHETLRRAVGMFTIALWDRESRELWLARDRMGEKPLYYGNVAQAFYFASELKAISAIVPGDALEVDRDALAELMRFGCIPSPGSIYRGIYKLPAGHVLRVDAKGIAKEPERFWSLDSQESEGLAIELGRAGDDRLISMLEERLARAVAEQAVADVPLGAFLSGGVDSSVVVALMQRQSSRAVRTFTIGFADAGFDEAPHARAVAQHLGTDHTELYVEPRHAIEVIPELPQIYDEPFADSSQIPTTLVARLTRQHVTVSLSGDGGDELFAGYPRYQFASRVWRRTGSMPRVARVTLAKALAAASPRQWDRLLSRLPWAAAHGVNGHRVARLSQLLRADSFEAMYVRLVSQWQPEDDLVLGAAGRRPQVAAWTGRGSELQRMRRWDLAQYLPDDILVKVDRASMRASLESRAPLLDHRVVEFAFALPDAALERNGESKWLLRQLLYRHVPRALIDRPKSGFSIPLAAWLRGPLRDWAEGLLDQTRLVAQGFLDARAVSGTWADHLAGRVDRSVHLWNVLMFQAWLHSRSTSARASEPNGSLVLYA